MSDDKITINFKCTKCGGTILELPDDYTDDSITKCKSCGQVFGPYRNIKAEAVKAAKGHVESAVRDIFKGLK